MSSTGIFGSLNWAASGTGGLYKTSLISMRVAGWLHFVGAMFMFLFAILGLVFGIVGAEFMADMCESADGCSQKNADFLRDGGVLIGMAMLLIFGFMGGILLLVCKLESVAARRMAQCCEAAKGWFLALGIISAVFAVFAISSGDFISFVIDLYFAIAFIVFPLMPDVKDQLTVSKADAQALERGA